MNKKDFLKASKEYKELENELYLGKDLTLNKCSYCGSENVAITQSPNGKEQVAKCVNLGEKELHIFEPGPIYLYKVRRNCGKILKRIEVGSRM